MFGSLGFPELILIFFVALIVFGPKKLPEIGRTIGKALGEFKKATDDFKNTIEREVHLDEMKQLTPSLSSVGETVSRSEPAVLAEEPRPVVAEPKTVEEIAALSSHPHAAPDVSRVE